MSKPDLGVAPHGDPWQLDLRSDGDGWAGSFAGIIRDMVEVIIDNGIDNDRGWEVQVTLADGEVLYGVIGEWVRGDTFTVTEEGELPHVIEVGDVLRLRV